MKHKPLVPDRLKRGIPLSFLIKGLGFRLCEPHLRLGESASQTVANSDTKRALAAAAKYIRALEAKVRAFDEVSESMGDCELSRFLAEEVAKHVAENDSPDRPDAGLGCEGDVDDDAEWYDCYGWTQDECDEWDLWQAEKLALKYEGWDGDSVFTWDEDSQPPSKHLRNAAASSAAPLALAGPKASPAPADSPVPPAAPAVPEARMNSTTHRAEYMRLASWMPVCVLCFLSIHDCVILSAAAAQTRQIQNGALKKFPECDKLAAGSLKDLSRFNSLRLLATLGRFLAPYLFMFLKHPERTATTCFVPGCFQGRTWRALANHGCGCLAF